MSALITITNVSVQIVPILINSIDQTSANDDSDLSASISSQVQIGPGKQLSVERLRVDLAQLEQLRRKNLLTYQ